jgi:predicted transcriptional regulator
VEIFEMVVNENIVTSSPRRIKLDAIARILEIGDMSNNNNNNKKDNAANSEDSALHAKLEELSTDFELEEYISLLHRKGFIEYDHKDNNTYRTTQKGFHILQLYQKVVMWFH